MTNNVNNALWNKLILNKYPQNHERNIKILKNVCDLVHFEENKGTSLSRTGTL